MKKAIEIFTLVIFFVFLLVVAYALHPFGEIYNTKMDDYFIQNGQAQTGSNNIVTSVVFDYRGMDTLGEATILFTAATGVFMIFWRNKDEKQ